MDPHRAATGPRAPCKHAAVAEGWFTQEGSALLGFPVLFEA